MMIFLLKIQLNKHYFTQLVIKKIIHKKKVYSRGKLTTG